MSTLKNKIGVWSDDAGQILGRLHEVQGLGFDYVILRAIHKTASGFVVDPHLMQLAHDAQSIGMPVALWAYVYPDDTRDQVLTLQQASQHAPNSVELVLDAECEWEHPGLGVSADSFLHAIAVATSHRLNLHLSSFGNPKEHSDFPYTACLGHCASFMPQAYQFPPRTAQDIYLRTVREVLPEKPLVFGGELIPTVNSPALLELMVAPYWAGANVWLWSTEQEDVGVTQNPQAWKEAISFWRSRH